VRVTVSQPQPPGVERTGLARAGEANARARATASLHRRLDTTAILLHLLLHICALRPAMAAADLGLDSSYVVSPPGITLGPTCSTVPTSVNVSAACLEGWRAWRDGVPGGMVPGGMVPGGMACLEGWRAWRDGAWRDGAWRDGVPGGMACLEGWRLSWRGCSLS